MMVDTEHIEWLAEYTLLRTVVIDLTWGRDSKIELAHLFESLSHVCRVLHADSGWGLTSDIIASFLKYSVDFEGFERLY